MNQVRGGPAGATGMGPGGGRRGGGPMGAMGRPVEKAKDFRGTLRRLVRYLMDFKYTFIAVFILAIGSTAFSIVGPKILGNATTKLGDGIIAQYTHFIEVQTAIMRHMPSDVITKLQMQPIPKFDFAYIGEIIVIVLVLYIISSFLLFLMGFLMSTVSQKVVFKMRNEVKEKLDQLPLKYFDEHSHGDILSRVTNDMDNIATTLQQSLGQLITSLVTIIGAVIMMISISPVLTLIALVTLPLSMIITMRIAKASQKYFGDQQKILGQMNGHVEEMYTGHKIIKVLAREKATIREFKKINAELYTASNKAQFMTGIIMPVLTFVNNVGYVAVCIVGGYFVAKNAIKIGDIQAFIQYTRTFTFPIVQTANIINVIQSTIASAERVFEILDENEQIPDRADPVLLEKPRGEVLFDHVDFSYKDDTPLIENMNMHVKPGDTVAIVGPTGAGKTTLVNLLMRFYEIRDGSISIDGVDIRDMERGSLRQMFGMVLQDTWLFNGTIRDNIAYGRDNVREEEVVAAAKAAHADHFISSLPDGYQTVLNEEASNISQGQKQLLTIARAILANPAILILDEATSNVDTRSEVLIQKAMAKLMEGRTSFVIAHRLSTIRDANTILVMNKGSIIEQGNHKQLLAQNGFYADLYNSQFSGAFIE